MSDKTKAKEILEMLRERPHSCMNCGRLMKEESMFCCAECKDAFKEYSDEDAKKVKRKNESWTRKIYWAKIYLEAQEQAKEEINANIRKHNQKT